MMEKVQHFLRGLASLAFPKLAIPDHSIFSGYFFAAWMLFLSVWSYCSVFPYAIKIMFLPRLPQGTWYIFYFNRQCQKKVTRVFLNLMNFFLEKTGKSQFCVVKTSLMMSTDVFVRRYDSRPAFISSIFASVPKDVTSRLSAGIESVYFALVALSLHPTHFAL
jgi:hypothetical protein